MLILGKSDAKTQNRKCMEVAPKSYEKKMGTQAKKELGAYYTPYELTDILSAWAIQGVTDKVLEPSFGGCGFLKSAADRLQLLGSEHPQKQLYGCDIDNRAFDYLHEMFHEMVDLQHFKLANFLNLEAYDWPKFDVVIGNPPYLSYHKIDKELRSQAIVSISDQGLEVDLRSGIWVYFVALGLGHLESGGRIAWVLPGSFLHSNYSQIVRAYLFSRFRRIQAFNIKQRLFLGDNTDEQTIILLADGFENRPSSAKGDIPLEFCNDLDDLRGSVEEWKNGVESQWSCGAFHQALISKKPTKLLSKLCESNSIKLVGDLADIRTGLVAGDKKFLILTAEGAAQNGINRDVLTPVVSGFKSIKGLHYSRADYVADLYNGVRSLMVSLDNLDDADDSLSAYLSTYPEEKIRSVATYKKRTLWCRVDDKNVPDAFLPVINSVGPKLVLNRMGVNCTNTLYRVYLKGGMKKPQQKLMSISLLTTFSQISAECVGRISGSGALKHEPREAEKIQLLMPHDITIETINCTYEKIDKLLRKGDASAANNLADQFILNAAGQEIEDKEMTNLRNCLRYIREHRNVGCKA